MTNPTPDYTTIKLEADTQQVSPTIKLNSLAERTDAISSSSGQEVLGTVTAKSTSLKVSCGIMKQSDETTTKMTTNNNKRKLTFKVDDKDEIEEEVYRYPFPSDVNDNDCWWMDDELDKLLTDAMLLADHYTRKRKDWQNKIKKIMKCVAGSSKGGGDPVKGSDLDFVVDSEARGLELYIHPIFQKNREKAIRGVVKVQEEYNASEKKKGKVDPELRVKVLRAQSLKLTQLARSMARTMADGDNRAAMKEDEEDDTPVDAGIPTEVSTISLPTVCPDSSEELIHSEELCEDNGEQPVQRMTRPRAKSVMLRSFSPKRALRS